jgi:hypothetical protein
MAFSRRSGRSYCGRLLPHLSEADLALCIDAADELKKLRHPNLQVMLATRIIITVHSHKLHVA